MPRLKRNITSTIVFTIRGAIIVTLLIILNNNLILNTCDDIKVGYKRDIQDPVQKLPDFQKANNRYLNNVQINKGSSNIVNSSKHRSEQNKKEEKEHFTSNPAPIHPKIYLGNTDICKNLNIRFFIYIHSAPQNIKRRENLRSTWANANLYRRKDVKVVFVLGRTNNSEIQKHLEKEFKESKDLLQGDFLDTYRNITLKGILAIDFIVKHCSHTKYVIKVDDDTFMNVFKVFPMLNSQKADSRFVVCPLVKENAMKILRYSEKCFKWCVKDDEFPGRQTYPQYCAGIFFAASYDVIYSMHKASYHTPFFWIDDIYITGLLLRQAKKELDIHFHSIFSKVTLIDLNTFLDMYKDRRKPVTKYIAHVINITLYQNLWEYALQRDRPTYVIDS